MGVVSFFDGCVALPDFGSAKESIRQLAHAMHEYVMRDKIKLDFILACGHNFYPT